MAEPDLARRVMHGSAARALAFVGGTLVTAIGSIFLLRHLGLVDFGRYGTVMAVLGIASGVTEGGLTIVATRDMALLEDDEDRHALLRDLLALRIGLSAVGVAAAVGFALAAGYGDELVLGALLAGIGVFFASVEAAFLVPLAVDLRNGRVALNEFVRQLLLVLGIVAFVVAGSELEGFFLNQLLAGAALLLVAPAIVGRANIVVPRWNWRRNVALIRAAAPLAIATVLAIVYFRVLVVLASLLTTEVEAARFVTSARVFEMLIGLPLLMTSVVLPVLSVAARDDPPRVQYVTQRLTEIAALAGALLCLLLAVAAEPILVTLGGEEYRTVAPVLQIQSPVIVTLFLAAAWSPALIALGHQRALAICTGLGLVAAIGLGLALIPVWGAEGAALAAVLAELVNAGVALLLLARAGPGHALHWEWVPKLLLAAALATAVALLLPAPALLQAIAGAAVLCAAGLALGIVPPEVLAAARRRQSPAGQ